MDLKSLEYFLKIADEKSISKVAGQLFISQPALSQHIQKLEESFGRKLMTRTNRGVRLTEAGIILDRHARNILRIYNQAFQELNQVHEDRWIIRIDANLTLATYTLPCMIIALKANPNFSETYFDLTFSTVNEVEKNIINGISDIGYVHQKKEYDELSYFKIGSDPLVLVAPSGYEIPDEIEPQDLPSIKLIELHDKFNEREPLHSFLETAGILSKNLNIVVTLDSTESVKTAVFRNFGLSFLPYSSVKKDLVSGQFKEVRIRDFHKEYPIYLVHLKERGNSQGLLQVLNHLKERKMLDFC